MLRWLTCEDGAHFDKITKSLAVLRPGLWPDLLLVTAGPLAAAVKVQWERRKPRVGRQPEDRPSGTALQVTSLLERALLYGISGQESVLSHRLGNAFGLTPWLTHGGLPCFAPVVDFSGPTAPSVSPYRFS